METLITGRMTATQPSDAAPNEAPTVLSRLQVFAYPLLRVCFAGIMLTHGLPKLLGFPHGSNKDPMGGLTNLIGNVLQLPAPTVLAVLVMLLETGGALMVAAGLKVRIVASLMVVHLCVAAYVHRQAWAWGDRGMEMPMTLALIALYLVLRGSGPYSIDRRLGWEAQTGPGARHD